MLKKTITYTDFNGDEVSEDHFFHLSKAELVKLELSHTGGLSASLQRIVAAEDGKEIIKEFENIILTSYGKRSDDGKRFIKNETIREEFKSSEAYSTLFMELVTNTDSAVEFVNGIVPSDMVMETAEMLGTGPPVPVATAPPEIVSRASILEMTQEEVEQLGKRIAQGSVQLGD